MRLVTRRLALMIALLTTPTFALGGCASLGGSAEANVPKQFSPTGTVSPLPTHVDAVPAGFRVASGTGFTIAIPESWKGTFRAATTAKEGDMWIYQEVMGTAANSGVSVVLDATPANGPVEQSFVLESSLKVQKPISLNRTLIDWPGASTAVLIDWTVQGKHTRQLMAQKTAGGPILSVVQIQKSEEGFSETLDQVLSTFTLTQ